VRYTDVSGDFNPQQIDSHIGETIDLTASVLMVRVVDLLLPLYLIKVSKKEIKKSYGYD